MGRTLHYSITGNGWTDEARIAVLTAQVLWNSRFTWTCEQLSLGRTRVYPFWPRGEGSGLPSDVTGEEAWDVLKTLLWNGFTIKELEDAKLAYVQPEEAGSGMSGFTKVAYDEWNAYLVVRFLEWVSRTVPDSHVRVSDEGDFILASALGCRAGVWSLDRARIEENRRYWRKHGYALPLARSKQAVLAAKRGRFFAEVRAADYLDRPEFAKLRLRFRQGELTAMTLAEVARFVSFPGEKSDAEQVAA